MPLFFKKKFKESDCCRYCKHLISDENVSICKYTKQETELGGICKKYVFNPFAPRIRRVRTLDMTMFDPMDFRID